MATSPVSEQIVENIRSNVNFEMQPPADHKWWVGEWAGWGSQHAGGFFESFGQVAAPVLFGRGGLDEGTRKVTF